MIIVIMGVSGSGKTTIGRCLAAELDWEFHEGDDDHPPQNIRKLKAGIPLDDEDRLPWLHALETRIRNLQARGQSAVISCSALKESYRQQLAVDRRVQFVFLHGGRELLGRRLETRSDHFMPAALLDSQLRDLEEPGPEIVRLDVEEAPEEIVRKIRDRFGV